MKDRQSSSGNNHPTVHKDGPPAHADDLPDFRELVEHAAQGILIHRNFKPLYANHAFAELFGFETSADVMALPIIRPLIPVDMWPHIEASYDEFVRGKRPGKTSWIRAIKIDGSEIWLSLTERLVKWHGKTVVQWNLFDVSQRMAIEQSLVESEQRLRSMLEILPTPIYIERRSDGHLMFVNRKTCLMFQQSTGPLLKRKSFDFFATKEDWDQLRVLLDNTPDLREMEVRMKTASGRNFIVELASIALDYGGTPAVLVALNDISQRKELEIELFHQASTDALTGISNRRYFLTQAEADLRRARRYSRDMALMMCDVDFFKHVNDQYGHAVGDTVLQEIVRASLESLRDSDIMGRLGGEEFAILLPETDLAAALEVADRLRQHVADHPIKVEGKTLHCSLSIGVARLAPQDKDIDALLQRADDAMYVAKNNGRNRIIVAP
ncbi:MAG: sensor domain-containing diguanylate cyclase [Alphaproteobacteria bacterium]|nr:sensor domain-containing diguanylate cyclase [Alphaproteobacteria bacterium]